MILGKPVALLTSDFIDVKALDGVSEENVTMCYEAAIFCLKALFNRLLENVDSSDLRETLESIIIDKSAYIEDLVQEFKDLYNEDVKLTAI